MKRILSMLALLSTLSVILGCQAVPTTTERLECLPAEFYDPADVFGGYYIVGDRLYVYVDTDAGEARVAAYEEAIRARLGDRVGFTETDRSYADLMAIRARLLERKDAFGILAVTFHPYVNGLVVNVKNRDDSSEAAVWSLAGFDCLVLPEDTILMVFYD